MSSSSVYRALYKPKLCEQGKTHLGSIPPNLPALSGKSHSFWSPPHPGTNQKGTKSRNYRLHEDLPKESMNGALFPEVPSVYPITPSPAGGLSCHGSSDSTLCMGSFHQPWQSGDHKLGQELTLKKA